MGILTDNEIKKRMEEGFIKIKPFDEKNLNPNSYDLTLYKQLKFYPSKHLDPRDKETMRTIDLEIPEDGLLIRPPFCYLARTNEYTETLRCVPTLHGKSGIGRMFLSVSNQAGYGDNGFCGYWTLQLIPHFPIVIYPNMKIVQIQYETLTGLVRRTYDGHYQNSKDIVPSKLHEEMNDDKKVS